MPFSNETLNFLFENRSNNSKEWFHAHKADYDSYVKKPFAELIAGLEPTIHTIDKEILCDSRRISRIYRDTRFSKDKSLFRENMWCSLSRPKDNRPMPEFYFVCGTSGISYGCGYYQMSREAIEAMRLLILSNDESFLKAKKAVEKQKVFAIGGDLYKRSKYPNQPEDIQLWLNRKNIYAYHDSKDFDLLFSEGLAQKVASDMKLLKNFYMFLLKAESMVISGETEK